MKKLVPRRLSHVLAISLYKTTNTNILDYHTFDLPLTNVWKYAGHQTIRFIWKTSD